MNKYPSRNVRLKLQFLLAMMIILPIMGRSQTVTDSYKTKITPPSPNAAALAKYGNIPVSYYTGIPSIDIPIYVAKSGEIELPISLSYHAGGVKLNEEAGWTGLGWTLNAGGAVSRMINDKDDLTATYFTSLIPEMTQPTTTSTVVMSEPWGPTINRYFTRSGGVYDWQGGVSNFGSFDLEADIFNYSFSGRGGKFSFTRSQQILQEKKSDLLIERINVNSGFKITDENGLQYVFTNAELTDNGTQVLATSWYLSKIYSPKGDSITFTYVTGASVAFLPRVSEIYRKGCDAEQYSITTASASHQIKYLTSIGYRNGRIDFEYSNQRDDMFVPAAGKKLSSIKIYTGNEAQPSKRFDLSYSYFNDTQSYVFKRLKLDQVTEFGSDNSALPPHEFTYEDVPNGMINLTGKNSFSVDHWGYFNGASNSSYVPGYTGLATWGSGSQLQTTFENISGANRDTNPAYSKIFSLKEIKYPTGGKTAFDFESNTYDNELSLPSGQPLDIQQLELVNKQQQFTISAAGTTNGSVDFSNKFGNVEMSITFRCSANNACATVKSTFAYGSIYFQSLGLLRDLMGPELTCNPFGPVCTTTISNIVVANTLQPWTAYIAPAVVGWQDIVVIFRWAEPVTVQPTYINENRYLYCGGIRVKKITNYSADGETASMKNYEYHYAQDKDLTGSVETYSYGRRMSPPSYYRNEILTSVIPTGDANIVVRCPAFTRYSNSISELSNSAQGNIVGYDRVVEYDTDSNGGVPVGKTVMEFHNQIDSLVSYRYPAIGASSGSGFLDNLPVRKPGIKNLTSNLNGNLKSKTYYKTEGATFKIVKEEKNYYNFKNRFTLYNLAYESVNGGPMLLWLTFVYPAFRAEIIQLDSTVSREYNAINELQVISSGTRYYYESSLHVQPTRIVNYSSDGNLIEKRNRTSLDNISGLTTPALDAKNNLVSKHIISPVLESETIENGQAQIVRTNYKISAFGLALPENIQTKFGSPTFDKRVDFLNYDNKGNLTSQAKTSDLITSYIWGYNFTYPIAEVLNAKPNEIYYTSFEETEANSTKGDSYCGDWSRTNGYTKSINGLTTNTTYQLTYWQKQGSQWVFQSSDISLISPTTSYIISITGQVDDIRFYPKAAQITTYTYNLSKGITSVLDTNNFCQYFEYDAFGRLIAIRDDKKNLLKTYVYNYKK